MPRDRNGLECVTIVIYLSCGFTVPPPRTLWGDGFGECTTYRETGDPAWTCPAAVRAYADIFGPDADVVESGGDSGKRQLISAQLGKNLSDKYTLVQYESRYTRM